MHTSDENVSFIGDAGKRNIPHNIYSGNNLADQLPVAIYTCDTEGYLTYYNKAAADLWGREPKIGVDLWCGSWKIYDKEGIAMALSECPMATFLNGKTSEPIEIIIEQPEGKRFNVIPNTQPLFDENGKLFGAVSILNVIERPKSTFASGTDTLTKREERYYKMVEEVSDYAIILLDTDGKILNWNLGAQNIKGYSSDEICGKNFRIFYSAEDRQHKLPESLLEQASKEGKATHEGWRIKKDGSRFWGSIVITALHDAAGEIIGFSKVTRDLTERKAAEEKQQRDAIQLEHKNEQLRRSEERYHKMISEVEDYAIILLDIQGNIMNWNKGAENIKGYTSQEIIGRNFSIFYRSEDIATGLPDKLISIARDKGKAIHEGWRIRKNGSVFWGSIVITALHDTENNIIGFSKVTRDLTERKMSEERQERYTAELQYNNELLRRSEERYHRMIAEVEDYAIILLDSAGNVLNWNRGAEKIKGYSEEEIVGKNFNIFYLEDDRRTQLPEKLLAEAVANNKATHEGWRVRKDGTHFWGSIVITALHDDDNKIIGFSKVTRDLTQKKRAEEQIEIQNKQLEEYAYVASHDLQEPLRKIQIYSELLEDSLDNRESALRNLEKINSSAKRMATLIKDVLNYSQISHKAGLFEEVNLNDIISSIETDFEMLLEQKNGKITYDDLPVIHAIPIQMHQLFSNLINNSIKFSHKNPEVHITSKVIDSGKSVKITLSDNGIGFEPQYAEHVFKMFQRLHDNKQGTGIGLALCRKIVDNHNGSISVSSKPGEGTIFEIVLPLNN
ncbi:MAG TPA: PAS domain-containing sensor histidine kinase [Flavobacterium sp.]|jgi:PAS domain S-box-containing protein